MGEFAFQTLRESITSAIRSKILTGELQPKCILHPFHAVSSALRLEVVWEFLPGNMQKESAHLTR